MLFGVGVSCRILYLIVAGVTTVPELKVNSCFPYLWFVAKFTPSIVNASIVSVMCYHKDIKTIQYSSLHANVVVFFLWRVS